MESAHFIKKKKFFVGKSHILGLFFLISISNFGCRNPASEIKLVLEQYDQINQDYFSSMRKLHQDNRSDTFLQDLALMKDRCNRVRNLDISRTPSDFVAAFNKVAFSGCENKTITDMTTYEGDPKTRMFRDAEKELESVCSRYGYIYKHSSSPK